MHERHIEVPRTARYVTLGPDRGATDIWLACHGYGQLARFFARHFAPLASDTRLIIVPEALNRFYIENPGGDHRDARVGATWMTRDDRLAEIEDYVRYLNAVLAASVPAGDLARAKVTALGFSQGVATVCRWAARGTPKVSRLVLWGEKLPPDLDLTAAAPVLRALDLIRVAGEEDPATPPDVLAADSARLDAHGIPHRTITFPGGHRLDAGVLLRLAAG
jgi:predicted esterase